MGYSAFTPMKSTKAAQDMYDWMAEHYRPWFEVAPPEEQVDRDFDWTGYLCIGDELSYNGSKTKVGFNFSNSGGIIGHYGFSLLRWMALRAGKCRKANKQEFGDLAITVPVIQYDYDPAWPVLLREEWEGNTPEQARWCLVDEHGYKPFRRPWLPPWVSSPDDPVVVKVTIPALTEGQETALREWFDRRMGEAPEGLDDELREAPYEFRGDCSNLYFLAEYLTREGIEHTTEDGPLVLYGYRKRMFEESEAAFLAAEAAIHAELKRLTALWESR
jgi:hypothetical protein